MTLEQVIEVLKKNPNIKTSQLAAKFGVTNNKMASILRSAQKENLAHISEWEYNPKGKPLARWTYGAGEPARRFSNDSTEDAYTLRPRIDPMIWATVGRKAPEIA
jgi:predicted ArsR family transcriptional regulator